MILRQVNTRVRSSIDPTIEGTIVGYGTIENVIKYLVLLDKGVWTPDARQFISTVVWDPSSIEE